MQILRRFLEEEDGMGTLEVVVIVAVLLAMAVVFKEQVLSAFRTVMGNIKQNKQKLNTFDAGN